MDYLFHDTSLGLPSFLIKLCLAFIFGGLIGWERGSHSQALGIRTHILIALGSALVMAGGLELAKGSASDPSRMAAQVLSGIGFLGAGAIFKFGLDVKGLTTAASLWATAALGITVGAGLYLPALIAVLFILLTLKLLAPFSHRLYQQNQQAYLNLQGIKLYDQLELLEEIFAKHAITSEHVSIGLTLKDSDSSLRFLIHLPQKLDTRVLVADLARLENLQKINIEPLR